MADRSWGAWKSDQDKFGSVSQSQDFRRKKKGVVGRFMSWLKGLFGKG